jgi:hypothetical protein
MTLDTFEVPEAYRQSLLATFDECALATRFELEDDEADWNTSAQARGTLFHRIAEEIMRTAHRTGETQIPTQEAIEVMYEVCAQEGVPPEEVLTLPKAERDMLRYCVLSFAEKFRWSGRIIDIERRLYTQITCQDGVERTLTGKLDLLAADPPDGALVVDLKTGWGPAITARNADPSGDDHPEGKQYLSARGTFQLDVYGVLVMRNYPTVQRVKMRETHVLTGEMREATLKRAELEHVEREIGLQMMHLERALKGGPSSGLWKPTPGKHCAYCTRPNACPIEADVRVFASQQSGGISSAEQAARLAGEYLVAGSVRKTLHEALKDYVDVHGPIPVKAAKGRYQVGWTSDNGGRRKFGVSPVRDEMGAQHDPDLEAVFAAAAQRKRATA